MNKWIVSLLVCWSVAGDLVRTIDGDTFVANLEIFQQIRSIEHIRVLGIDTPEMRRSSRPRGLKAKAFADEWLKRGPFRVESCRRDSFGRILGKVYRDDSVLATELKKAGHMKENSRYNR
jgi:endonuclease YncB( thermonuclease family)